MPIIISGSNGISGVDGTAAAPAVQGADNNTGMFFPAADTIAFSEGGTEVLRLNASGNAVFTGTIQVAGITTDIYPRVLGTAVASTSGTAIDFTGIPSWVRRITVMFNGVSTNGTNALLAQLGTSAGIVSSGYTTTGAQFVAGASSMTSSVAGQLIPFTAATDVFSGHLVATLLTGSTWVLSFVGKLSTTRVCNGGGDVTLSGVLDRVRLTTVTGTDTFDAGSVNILWE